MRKILIGVAAVVAASAVGLAVVRDAGTDVTDMVAVANTTSVVRLQTLWLSTATRAGNSVTEYGTDSDVTLTVYQGSERVLLRTILGRGGRFDQGAADLVPISVYSENIRVVPANPALTVRLTIRGDDAWVADFIMLFGQGGGLTFPIGTLTPRGLSTDPGDLAVRTTTLRPTVLGNDSTSIESLLLLTETSSADDAGTDSRISVTRDAGGRTYHTMCPADTSQDDLEGGAANAYPLPWGGSGLPGTRGLERSFTRSSLVSMGLRIHGDDAWLPSRVFVFGMARVDFAGTQLLGPEFTIVPLVAVPTWRDGWLSSDYSDSTGAVGARETVSLRIIRTA